MDVTVSPTGTVTLRLDYRLNGRRETLTMSRYGARDCISLLTARERFMSKATLNRVTQVMIAKVKEWGFALESFTVHDWRRTGSTIRNELGAHGDWVEQCLAHEDGRSSGVEGVAAAHVAFARQCGSLAYSFQGSLAQRRHCATLPKMAVCARLRLRRTGRRFQSR